MEREAKEKESVVERAADCEIDSIQQYFGALNTGMFFFAVKASFRKLVKRLVKILPPKHFLKH